MKPQKASEIQIPGDLGAIGRDLVQDPNNAGVLRSIEEKCKALEYEAPNQDIRFLAFFLSAFIDDFFYNLAGDIPYSKDLTVLQNRVLAIIGQKFQDLTHALEAEQSGAYYAFCKELAVNYLDLVAEARDMNTTHAEDSAS